MSVTLLLGPVGSGKTDRALADVLRLKAEQPLAAVWVLVASERQKIAFRERLLAAHRGAFNVHFFNFDELYRHLTQAAGSPRRVLHSATRAALLRQLLRERYAEPGALFRPLPGFVDALGRQFDELTLWLVSPETFAAHTRHQPRLAEIAGLYVRYKVRLASLNLLDREGLGAAALQVAQSRPDLLAGVDRFIVDGLDQLNPLHAHLIATLAHGARSALITLSEPVAEAGAATAYSRFGLARQRLKEASPGPIPIERLSARDSDAAGRRAIRHLAGQVWSPRPLAADSPPAEPGALLAPGVNLLEAADPAAETAAVLRRVKALLLGAAGVGPACRPDDILIAVRDWALYGPHLQTLAERYHLSLVIHQGAPLAENPAVAAFLRLLALPDDGYRRLDVIDALRTPCVRVPGFPANGVLALETASRRYFVISGRDEWLTALDLLARGAASAGDEDDDSDTVDATPGALRESAAAARAALASLFDALELAGCARTADYVSRLDAWIGEETTGELWEAVEDAPEPPVVTLGLLACVAEDANPARQARDRRAVVALKNALRGLQASAAMMIGLGITPDEPVNRGDFLASLRREIAGTTLDQTGGRDGRVLATTVNDARGLPHRHVFLLGLSEGVFPAPVAEDPLLLESERQALCDDGLQLPLRAERADDSGLFYELVGLASDTLTLSRPTLRNGAPWVESALWRTARTAFAVPRLRLLPVGAAPPAEEAACVEEAALAVAEGVQVGLSETGRALACWLAAHDAAAWQRLRRAYAVESSRIGWRTPYDAYAGKLADAGWVAALAARFGSDYPWSASQLNTLGECGFRFFSSRLLRLEPLDPPQVGMDARQRGQLLHEILERTYRQIQVEGLAIAPPNAGRAQMILDAEARATFTSAPHTYIFRPRPGWAQETDGMRAQLAALLAADFEGDVVVKAFRDAPVGDRGDRTIELIEGSYDEPALLRDAEGAPVRVRGRFDRIDRQGDFRLVVDYKSGSTPIPHSKTKAGRNFQMMIYLLAVQAQFPGAKAGGFFWHLPRQDTSGVLWLESEEGAAVVADGLGHISARIAEARAGDYAVRPNGMEAGQCSRYCDYARFCRMAVTARYKAAGKVDE